MSTNLAFHIRHYVDVIPEITCHQGDFKPLDNDDDNDDDDDESMFCGENLKVIVLFITYRYGRC